MPRWYTRGGKFHLAYLHCAKRLNRCRYHVCSLKLAFTHRDHSQVVRELEDEHWYDGSTGDSMSLRSQRPSFLRGRVGDLMGIAGRLDSFGEAQWRLPWVRLRLKNVVFNLLCDVNDLDVPRLVGRGPLHDSFFYLVSYLIWLALFDARMIKLYARRKYL